MRPADLREAQAVVASTTGPLRVVGGGTKSEWGNPSRSAVELSTAKLCRIHEHDPADMTAKVGAGMPLAALQAHLRASGQWLAIDPPAAADATIGGLFATNDSGPARQGYGSMRELVIGMTVVLADGTVARSGGRVIKNVAGYDLCRLFCGALGTLGLVVDLTLRLHPLPAASRSLALDADAERARVVAATLARSPLEPAVVDHDGARLWIRFDGSREAVDGQAERARQLLGPLDDADEARWRRHRERLAGLVGETVLRVGVSPDHYANTVSLTRRLGRRARLDTKVAAQVGLGLIHLRWRGDAVPPVRELREALNETGGHAVIRRRSRAAVKIDGFGVAPSGLDVMRRIKDQLDPRARWAPGRYLDW